jgi:hypothetical protein
MFPEKGLKSSSVCRSSRRQVRQERLAGESFVNLLAETIDTGKQLE